MVRVLPAIVLLALVLVAPPLAGAQGTVSLRPLGEYVVDKSFFIVAEGNASTVDLLRPHHLRITDKNDAPHAECSLYEDIDRGLLVVGAWPVPISPFMDILELPAEIAVPGRVLFCGWVYEGPHWRAGPGSLYVDFVAPRHELRIVAPRRVARGRRATVRFVGTAAVQRVLLARIARGRKPCGLSDTTNRAARLTQINDVPPGPINQAARTPRLRRGTYTVCAYLHRKVADPRAEAVARQVIRAR